MMAGVVPQSKRLRASRETKQRVQGNDMRKFRQDYENCPYNWKVTKEDARMQWEVGLRKAREDIRKVNTIDLYLNPSE